MEISIILEITSYQIAEYKEFFIDGLLQNENKFRISPDDERRSAFPTNYMPDSFTLGAYVDDQLAGVVSFERKGATREN